MAYSSFGGVEPDETVWGKSRGLDYPYPLVRHLLDAAALALHLWEEFLSLGQRRHIAAGLGMPGDLERARALVALCAGLHDVGKISGFQACDSIAYGSLSAELRADTGKIGLERLGHDVAGMEATPAILKALGFEGDSSGEVIGCVAEIIGGHHGRFCALEPQRADNPAHAALLGGPRWAAERVAHARTVYALLGSPAPPEKFAPQSAVLVTGVVILADWLVSQESYLRDRQRKLPRTLREHFEKSRAGAPPLLKAAGLETVELDRKPFAEAYGVAGQPNALQRSLLEDLPAAVAAGAAKNSGAGIALITAAPGDGKTEAALEAERVFAEAFGTRGFAFLLPTMATSDQMYLRVSNAIRRQYGEAAGLTLTHSMAWLNDAYADEELESSGKVLTGEEGEDRAARRKIAMRPKRWLRGRKRPLLAQYAVGTIDQALMAVLPVRHNALRLLALSGKTFVVDEAHAYDPYMQVLLGRLLNWLGAYGVPVVLLSATLPSSISKRLVKEYLRGAGRCSKADLRKLKFTVPYPGWLYVDAGGFETLISDPSLKEQQAVRPVSLDVSIRPVRHVAPGVGCDIARLDVIERELAPLMSDEGGCALVVCNTVPQAQETYTWLRDRFGTLGLGADEIQLLHARFPGEDREQSATRISTELGRSDTRPSRRIVVATQVVEQSLDLDADIVISDLAPLALLLQRAGRCWRHEMFWRTHGRPGNVDRPAWAKRAGARLVVLDPLANGGSVPKSWSTVYAEALLLETSGVLAERAGKPVRVPHDVQDLVERVHGDRRDRFDWGAPDSSAAWTAFLGEELAQRSKGQSIVIRSARMVASLDALHHTKGLEDEERAATRLGADSVRLLCVYEHPDKRLTLDPEGEVDLPRVDKDGHIATRDVRAVMRRTIPVRAEWFAGHEEAHQPPGDWSDHPFLGDLLVLHQPTRDAKVTPVQVGDWSMRLDDELGLVRSQRKD